MAGVSEYPDDGFGGGGGASPGGFGGGGGMIDPMDEYGDSGPQEPLRPCQNCGRKFKESSLAKHERICSNVRKERKVFNSTDARVKGTEAAKFVGKSGGGGDGSGRGSGGRGGGGSTATPGKNPKWKQQSNQLRDAMKAARQITQAQKDGVDIRTLDLPTATVDDADDGASCFLPP